MGINTEIRIREATLTDEDFIASLVPRLTDFGAPSWRKADEMTETDADLLRENLRNRHTDTAIYVAEIDGVPLGIIHLQPGTDYYNKEEHGHITDLIVAAEGEGRGVGSALLAKGEDWARKQGYKWITLSVFAKNTRARELYERKGYGADMFKYIKELD